MGTTLFQPSGANKATQLQIQLVSLLSPRGEDFRIRDPDRLRLDHLLPVAMTSLFQPSNDKWEKRFRTIARRRTSGAVGEFAHLGCG